MPLENSVQNEPVIESESNPKKSYRLTIILIILIVLAGSYLAYAVYKSSQTDSDTSTVNTNSPVNEATPVEEVSANPAPNDNTNLKVYTQAQVAEKNSKASCWTIINGDVYDITSYVPKHPGGEDNITQVCGKDGSQLFAKPMEHKEGGASNVITEFKIGTLAK
jgi:cytochrome b involved in lipid metabolism